MTEEFTTVLDALLEIVKANHENLKDARALFKRMAEAQERTTYLMDQLIGKANERLDRQGICAEGAKDEQGAIPRPA